MEGNKLFAYIESILIKSACGYDKVGLFFVYLL